MLRLFQFMGSLQLAVPLLVAIAAVLGWGTLYETRFGTASVQRFVYQSWWFQLLLAFLAVNLAVAALRRYPWRRKHVPFVLAHIGIVLVLAGGIIGGRFGIEGQMVIPEGETSGSLRLSQSILMVHPLNPGQAHLFPVRFETQAWVHEPLETFRVPFQGRALDLTVDRYFPNARAMERVTPDGPAENPAVRLALRHGERSEELWLFARDPARFGAGWEDAHILFLEAKDEEEFARYTGAARGPGGRGALTLDFPALNVRRSIPIPEDFSRPAAVEGTPYQVTFKEYFSDFALTDSGVVNRSGQPDNPALGFTLSGPEGTDPHLVFAFHPEFPEIHARPRVIHAHASYQHPASVRLPPRSLTLLRLPPAQGAHDDSRDELTWVFTGGEGELRASPFQLGEAVRHPWMELEVRTEEYLPQARLEREFVNRDDEVKSEVLRLTARDGGKEVQAWLEFGGSAEMELSGDRVHLEYRKAMRDLPFSVKLIDFRKIDYPGIQMAAGFEADVELTDPERGVTLKRKISMNNPLKYRGYTLFQSSFIQGPVETTVLSVRNDPGVPLVYGGFLIIVAGVAAMFILRPYRRPAGA